MKIKLFSTFIALALLVTVGGVYAAWVYGQDASGVSKEFELTSANTIVVQTGGAVGELTITASNPKITVQESPTPYVPQLATSGSFDVKFVPSPSASVAYLDQTKVKLDVTITLPAGSAYEAATASFQLTKDTAGYDKSGTDEAPIYTWTGVNLDGFGLSFVSEWEEPIMRYEDYQEFSTAASKVGKITVSLVPAT